MLWVPHGMISTTWQSNALIAPWSTGAPVTPRFHTPSENRASPYSFGVENSRAMPDWSSSRKLTENAPLPAMIGSAEELRLTQTRIVGGSAVAEQTAVAVSPQRVLPFCAAITATGEATCRIADLNSAAVTGCGALPAAGCLLGIVSLCTLFSGRRGAFRCRPGLLACRWHRP